MRQAWWQRRIYHFQVVGYGVRNPPQSDHITEIWWDSTKCQVEVKRNTNSIHVDNLSTRIQTRENNLMCSFWTHEVGCAVLPAWISCPLPAAFSGSPTWGSSPGIPCRRSCGFQGSTGKTATKKPSQNRPAMPSLFLEGHASRLCNGWKPKCSAPQGLNEYVKICYIQLLG